MTGFLVHQLYGERYEEASRKAQGQGERASLWGAEIIQYGNHGTEQGKVREMEEKNGQTLDTHCLSTVLYLSLAVCGFLHQRLQSGV